MRASESFRTAVDEVMDRMRQEHPAVLVVPRPEVVTLLRTMQDMEALMEDLDHLLEPEPS